MPELQLLTDLVVAIAAAFVGGTIAQRVGLPVIVGYLLAGVALGPFTPGLTVAQGSVSVLAEIGVALLMFALGAEFSQAELRSMGRVAVVGGAVQLLGTMALGPLLAPMLHVPLTAGVFLGALLALSSTVVALKLLMARGELQDLHGRVAVGILVAQDVAVVPMVVLLPALLSGRGAPAASLALTIGEAVVLLLVTYLVGARAAPWLLGHLAVPRSRELFLLGIVTLALGTALVARAIGLSLAFGAFVAGLAIAESEYRAQVVAEVLPLRDLFTSLFFVSVGMLINPGALLADAAQIGLLTVAVVGAKVVLVTVVVTALGMPGRVAVLAGLAVAQLGEFSFVLGKVGVDAGAIPPRLFDLILATSLTTIFLAPFLLRSAPLLVAGLRRLPLVGRRFESPAEADVPEQGLRRHAVICGYGRVGRELGEALARRQIPVVVIDYHPDVVRQLRERRVPVVYGDASNPAVLQHAFLDRARLLAALVPDPVVTELTVRQARAANPRLDILARATTVEEVPKLRRAGASEVVQPEFEAGIEIIRHALLRYGVTGPELNVVMSGRRAAVYGEPGITS